MTVLLPREKAGFKYPNAKEFENLLKAICVVNEEPPIEFKPLELQIMCMDPAHVMLVNATIERYEFAEYWVRDDESIRFVFSLANVLKFFKHIDKSYSVSFVLEDIKEKGLTVMFNGQDNRKKKFVVDVYEASTLERIPLNIEFTAEVKVKVEPIIEAIKDVVHSLNAYELALKVDEKAWHFTVSAEWDNVNYQMELSLTDEPISFITNFTDKDVVVRVDANYLYKILNAIKPLADSIKIELATNKPIKITVPLKPSTCLHYFLAPRI